MNSLSLIAFTRNGCALAWRLAAGLAGLPEYRDAVFRVHIPARLAGGPDGGDAGVQGADSLEPAGASAAEPENKALPFGDLGSLMAECFAADDALVFVGATGIAVRAIAPLADDKLRDPAVVSVDEAGRFAVPLLSGHVGGANRLSRAVAGLLGGQAAVSTATDVNGVFAVDEWAVRQGLALVEREVARAVAVRLLEGGAVGFHAEPEWPHPEGAAVEGGQLVEDSDPCCPRDLGFAVGPDVAYQPFARTLHLVPRRGVVGVGCRRGTSLASLERAVDAALEAAGMPPVAVEALATIDVKCDEPALGELARKRGWVLRFYRAEELAAVPGEFVESAFVERTVGVGNVCERAALAEGGRLVLGRQTAEGITVAVALRADAVPETPGAVAQGSLTVVGIGPGGGPDLTGRARQALAASEVIVGYPVYADLVRDDFPDKEVLTTPMRQEEQRCRLALERAASGAAVALVCSGDAGVYGMAGLVLELAPDYPGVDVQVVPGVSASNGGAAMLGAPLMHDHCLVSLSDLLIPWEAIEGRLAAAAEAGFAVVLYNPASRKRPHHLARACDVLLAHLPGDTVCGLVRNIGRPGMESRILTLAELRDTPVDMFTTVFVGNRETRVVAGRMVTPRGYRLPEAPREGAAGSTARPVTAGPAPDAPELLLFGGTTEGRELAEWLSARGRCRVVACCATEYGGQLVTGLPGVQPVVGPLDDAAKAALVAGHVFRCIVDATHPFATHISGSIARLAREQGLPLIRLLREDTAPGSCLCVPDMARAAQEVAARPGRVLLATGTRDLASFVSVLPDFAERLYVRVLPVEESVARARELGVPASHIIAMQGPFSRGMNEALMRDLGIALLVTKASGVAGGLPQKLAAAEACGVQVVLVGRPQAEEGLGLAEVKRELEERYGA